MVSAGGSGRPGPPVVCPVSAQAARGERSIGVAMIFNSSKNLAGWGLAVGSLACLVYGVIASLSFRIESMSAFELTLMLGLLAGGAGLFLSSLRDAGAAEPAA